MTKKQFYVYAIYVDGVVRYIGKGSNGRVHFHAIEARRINSRRARGANTDRTATKFYRKLAEAMRHGATITEEIMVDGLANVEAYRLERQKIEEVHKENRGQLWNTIDERLIGITWKEFKRNQREEAGLRSAPGRRGRWYRPPRANGKKPGTGRGEVGPSFRVRSWRGAAVR